MSGQLRKSVEGARLVSPSVRAAEGLSPTVKKQSVKNQLIRGGAKPLELEYAEFDKWLEGQQGEAVSSEAVTKHLREKGPLGRVKRLDTETDDKGRVISDTYDPSEDEDAFYNVEVARDTVRDLPPDERKFTEANDDWHPDQEARVPSDTSKPFDGRRSWPYSEYGDYTEADAWPWSPMAYREVMWFDPRSRFNRGTGAFSPNAHPRALDTHEAHAWVRYHDNKNALDVQNIQSDVGQSAESAARKKLVTGPMADIVAQYRKLKGTLESEHSNAWDAAHLLSRELLDQRGNRATVDKTRDDARLINTYPVDAHDIRDVIVGYGALDDNALRDLVETGGNPYSYRVAATAQWLLSLPEDARHHLIGAHADTARLNKRLGDVTDHGNRFGQYVNEQGFLHSPLGDHNTHSPLLDGGNWRQLPLRYLLLESAAQDGKPIHLPLGINVSAVESMPRNAARASYERHLPSAMMKILRGIGGGESQFIPGAQQRVVGYRDKYGNLGKYTLRVGPEGQRAGTVITPSKEAVSNIRKHGLDVLTLLLLAGGGGAAAQSAQQQGGPVTKELLK